MNVTILRRAAILSLVVTAVTVAACSDSGGTDPDPGQNPTNPSTMATANAAVAAANGSWTNVSKVRAAQGSNTAVTVTGRTGPSGAVTHTLILIYTGTALSGVSYTYVSANATESAVFACDGTASAPCNLGAVGVSASTGNGSVSSLSLQGVLGGAAMTSASLSGQLR